MYAGKIREGIECGWFLVWYNVRGSIRKVYAEYGFKINFNNFNWSDIEKKFDNVSSVELRCMLLFKVFQENLFLLLFLTVNIIFLICRNKFFIRRGFT